MRPGAQRLALSDSAVIGRAFNVRQPTLAAGPPGGGSGGETQHGWFTAGYPFRTICFSSVSRARHFAAVQALKFKPESQSAGGGNDRTRRGQVAGRLSGKTERHRVRTRARRQPLDVCRRPRRCRGVPATSNRSAGRARTLARRLAVGSLSSFSGDEGKVLHQVDSGPKASVAAGMTVQDESRAMPQTAATRSRFMITDILSGGGPPPDGSLLRSGRSPSPSPRDLSLHSAPVHHPDSDTDSSGHPDNSSVCSNGKRRQFEHVQIPIFE